MLTLLSASIPLATTYTSTLLALNARASDTKGEGAARTENVSIQTKATEGASSIHVFAFTAEGKLLLSESEGDFALEEWEQTHDRARELCMGGEAGAVKDKMDIKGEASHQNMNQWLRNAMHKKAEKDQRWKM